MFSTIKNVNVQRDKKVGNNSLGSEWEDVEWIGLELKGQAQDLMKANALGKTFTAEQLANERFVFLEPSPAERIL